MNPTTGFFTCSRCKPTRFLRVPTDLADHHDGVRIRIRVEQLNDIEEGGPDNRIAADPDAGGLPDFEPVN